MTNGEVILKLIKDVTGIELEIGEEFNVNYNLLKVTQEGLVYVDDGQACNTSLQGFIEVIKTIKVKPKFPVSGTKHYYVLTNGDIGDSFFDIYCMEDVLNFKIGNFFLTFEDAKKNKEKILKIFNSPEKFKGMADK